MKRILETLLALTLCLALALPCALAEDAYVPGETMNALFAEAWDNGQMITGDISLQLALNYEAMGLSEEDAKAYDSALYVVDVTTLRMGVCPIDGGVRVLLAGMIDAQEGAEDVYVDVAADITRAGVSIDSTLLPDRRVSITWNTLLQLAGLGPDEAQMVTQML